jgi:5'-3' exonuclease
MGIPWYFYNIYNKYNLENDLTIDEQSINKLSIDHLFLDYNSMIHPCAQYILKTTTNKNVSTQELDKLIIDYCLVYTRYIVNIVKPQYLYIMIDGVAPRAKINQQRERRFKSHFFKSLERTKDEPDEENIYWNSNKITPGTMFMNQLTNALINYKTELIKDCHLKNVIISDSDERGEGEHKMMKLISNNITELSDNKICIYGLDADLLMLSLINTQYNRIILLRDNTFNTKLQESKRVYTYVNIKKLYTYICKDLRVGLNSEIEDRNLIYDYIFLCFLLGNDFLEHIPSLKIKEGGINVLIKYYKLIINTKKEYKSLIIIDNLLNGDLKSSINLAFLQDLFYHFSKIEDYFYKNIYSVYKNTNENHYKDKYDLNESYSNIGVFFYHKDIINYNNPGYKERYYKFYNIENVNIACKHYLSGLYWILGYYNNHSHNNWSWYYPYSAVPFASDIFNYLLKINKKEQSNYNNYLDFKCLELSDSLTTKEQLLMVLPKDSLLEIISPQDIIFYLKLKRIFNSKSKQLQEYYPDHIYVDMIHKEFLWQSKIFLKIIDKDFIHIFL